MHSQQSEAEASHGVIVSFDAATCNWGRAAGGGGGKWSSSGSTRPSSCTIGAAPEDADQGDDEDLTMSDRQAGLSAELRERIEAFQKEMFPKVPPKVIASLQRNIENLIRSGIAARAFKAGDRAPDFSLPNARGETVSLSATLARGPAVVAFYRGHW
jgi:hypothetical protein